MRLVLSCVVAVVVSAQLALAGPFTTGNLVISRIGDGAAALSGNSAAVFLDEYTSLGSSVQSVAIPTTDSGANFALTLSGTSTSQGQLTLSADGNYLFIGGTNAPTGTSTPNSNGSFQGRTIARVGGNGVVDTTTRFVAAGTALRSVTSTDGVSLWSAGDTGSGSTGGARALTYGLTTNGTLLNATTSNIRTVNIFNGQLYIGASTGVGGDFRGVSAVGTGLPTTAGQTFSLLPGMGGNNTGNSDSTYDFYFADLNTLYVADDDTTAPASAGIQKWTFNGATWTKQWTVASGATNVGFRSITGLVTSGGVQLYAISGESSANRLVSLLDTGAGAPSLTTLATAGTNQIFRGVDFAPIPEPGAFLFGLALTSLVGGVTAYRRRK